MQTDTQKTIWQRANAFFQFSPYTLEETFLNFKLSVQSRTGQPTILIKTNIFKFKKK